MKFTNYLLLERNIINITQLNNSIAALVNIHGDMERISKWIKSNLKNYLLREYPAEWVPEDLLHRFKEYDEPWVKKAIQRGDKFYSVLPDRDFNQQISHVLDYFRVNPDLNISRISVPEAIRQSERWTEELNKKASDKEDKTGLEEVRKYPDGFRWVKVTSAQSLDREGKLMKHCVGSYCNQVSSGSTAIYSLRDKKNEPHCTVEVRGSIVNQIKGKANGPVDDKYKKYVQDFIMKPVSGKQYTGVSDLKNIGLIEVDNKYYELDNLPENLHVKGNLYLQRSSLTSLPKGLKVEGHVELGECKNLKSLPEGLKVGKSLDLFGCTGITSLPEDLQVGGGLYLRYCKNLKSLPKGLQIGGSIDLYKCTNLTSLLSDMYLGGSLSLYDCTSLTSLPKGLIVNGNLDLHGCTGLTSLPKGLKVKGDLYLYGCRNLRSLPDDLKVNYNIYVSTDMMKYFENSKFKGKID